MKQLAHKRITSTILGIIVTMVLPIFFSDFLGQFINRMSESVIVYIIPLIYLFLGGLTSGVHQPKTQKRMIVCILTGPGLWICLFPLFYTPVIAMFSRTMPLFWPVIFVVISAMGVLSGISIKERFKKDNDQPDRLPDITDGTTCTDMATSSKQNKYTRVIISVISGFMIIGMIYFGALFLFSPMFPVLDGTQEEANEIRRNVAAIAGTVFLVCLLIRIQCKRKLKKYDDAEKPRKSSMPPPLP